MTTSHLQIARAVADLLKVEPPIAGGRVWSGRTRPLPADAPDGVIVRLERSAAQSAAVMGGRTSWATLVSIECYGRVGGGAPDEAADQVAEAVFARLDSDPSLGGFAMDVEPLEGDTLAWDFDELDASLACITAKFLVRHQTTGRTLTQ